MGMGIDFDEMVAKVQTKCADRLKASDLPDESQRVLTELYKNMTTDQLSRWLLDPSGSAFMSDVQKDVAVALKIYLIQETKKDICAAIIAGAENHPEGESDDSFASTVTEALKVI